MVGSDSAKSSFFVFSQFGDLVTIQNINFNEKNIQPPPAHKGSVTEKRKKGKKRRERREKVLVYRSWGRGDLFSSTWIQCSEEAWIFHTGNVFCVTPCTTNLLLLILFSCSIDGPCVTGDRVLENSPHFVQYNTAFSTPNAATWTLKPSKQAREEQFWNE